MQQWNVTDQNGNTVEIGDTVTDFDGRQNTFQSVARGPVYGREAEIMMDGLEYYASVFGLTVRPVQYERTYVTEVRGPHDVNGNPRLGYIVLGWRGGHGSKFIAGGYEGFQAVRNALGDPSGANLGTVTTCQTTTTARGFKALRNLGKDLS